MENTTNLTDLNKAFRLLQLTKIFENNMQKRKDKNSKLKQNTQTKTGSVKNKAEYKKH